jgi:ABC-type polysaccharide/polyol phosphate transport system ATPase subunit
MQSAIHVEKLSKSYRLDEKEKRGGRTLGETIMAMAGAPFRRLGRRPANAADRRRSDIHWALKNVSFEVQPAEVCAVIGPNGAGKSTLFKILSRITKPTTGYVEIVGRLGSLLEVGTGFHPELTGRENVFLNGAILGMPRREIARKFDEIVAFAEIDHFIDMPVKRYSSGMHLRLAFAVAAHLEPDILLLDEVMSVGDAEFQKKSQQRIQYLTQQGITTLIISHALTDVMVLAKRGLYIRHGSLVYDGDLAEAAKLYHIHTVQELDHLKRSQTSNGVVSANGTSETAEVTPAVAAAPALHTNGTSDGSPTSRSPDTLIDPSRSAVTSPDLSAPADAASAERYDRGLGGRSRFLPLTAFDKSLLEPNGAPVDERPLIFWLDKTKTRTKKLV